MLIIFAVTIGGLLVIIAVISGLLWHELVENEKLKSEITQARSHNRYLVAKYGIGRVELVETKKEPPRLVTKQFPVDGDGEDYYDGIVKPQQYLDMELEWNKSENTSKS